jgi:hypothetical protein
MSNFCKHSWFRYWHHSVYTTLLFTLYSLLLTHYSLLIRYTTTGMLFAPSCTSVKLHCVDYVSDLLSGWRCRLLRMRSSRWLSSSIDWRDRCQAGAVR